MLMDDGELSYRLTHPQFKVPKEYVVEVRGRPDNKAIWRLRQGVELDDGMTAPAVIRIRDKQRSLEAQVADLADEIAYTNHDLDDGLHSGILEPAKLEDLSLWREARRRAEERVSGHDEALLRTQTIIALINALVTDVIESTAKRLERLEPNSVDAIRDCEDTLLDFSDQSRQAKIER